MLALFAGNLGMKTVTTPVLRRFGFRTVLLVNGVFTALAALACAALSPHTPRSLIFGLLFLNGLCRSMQFTSLNTLAFADVPKPLLSSATSFYSMATQMTMGMGVAIGAIALRVAAVVRPHANRIPSMFDFHFAFILISGLIVLAIFDCFALAPDAGAVVSGHRVSRKISDEAVEA